MTRTETDSFGPLEVPADKYWGAQTQRSIINFPIGWEKQPVPIIRALGLARRPVLISVPSSPSLLSPTKARGSRISSTRFLAGSAGCSTSDDC